MTLLQIFFILSGAIISIIALGIARRERFNALHFLVFLGVGGGLLFLGFFPGFVDAIGRIFWAARGADVLVYASIVFLFYFVLTIFDKIEKQNTTFSKLIRNLALEQSNKKNLEWEITLVIPAYNEARRIQEVIMRISKAGYKNCIIIDDGSQDGTSRVIEWMNDRNIVLLKHLQNLGQWAALETWFEYARRFSKTQFIATFDADGQHDIEDIRLAINALNTNKDIIIMLGSRFIKKEHHSTIPFSRKIIIKLGIIFTYLLSGISLTDTHNGFRVFRKELLDKLSLSMSGMEHASEFLDLIAKKKIRYQEIPTHIKYDEYSLSKGQKSSNAFRIAFRMICKKFF